MAIKGIIRANLKNRYIGFHPKVYFVDDIKEATRDIAAIGSVIFILFLNVYSKYQTTKKSILKFTTNINDYGNFRGFRGFSNIDIFPYEVKATRLIVTGQAAGMI